MSEFKDKLTSVRVNPGLMVNVTLNELERQLGANGSYDIPDANNPFVGLLETTMITAAMALNQDRISIRAQYATQAITTDDLYLHMDDDQYLGRFSVPAMTAFELFIDLDEVIQKAVPYGDNGARKLVIPRLTQFTVAEHVFTMQYPIELRVMSHGGIQVVYDATIPSPIQTLSSNLVPIKEIKSRDRRLLRLSIDVLQMRIETYTETLNAASIFDQTYTFPDQFYTARVFMKNGNVWEKVKTTHSDQSYDPDTLTAVLKVVNNQLRVTLPVIYNSTGKVKGTIRIDLYSTRGEIDLDLGSYGTAEMVLNDIDDESLYVAPLNTFNNISALNPNRVLGGSNAISFTELRDAIINNTLGPNAIPITNNQITAALSNRGYGLVSNIDNITKRQFLATKRLSSPVGGNVISGAGTLMAQLQVSMEKIALGEHVKDNGNRLTILPSQLYSYRDGLVRLVPDGEISRLTSASAETIVRLTVENRYLYSPFHYVLDANGDNFDVRPYYLGAPVIARKQFIEENETTQLQASVDSYSISRIDDGYRIELKLKSSDRFKDIDDELVVVQLGYRPANESNFASMNGTLLGIDGDERVYQFDILTNYDINSNDALFTTNLSMYDAAQTNFAVGLEHDLFVSVIVNDSVTPGYRASNMDLQVQRHLLDARFMVIGQESLEVTFGFDMTDLWRRNRTILSSESYQYYEEDVPYIYPENVYLRDDVGQIIIKEDAEGNLQFDILHRAGETMLDGNGKPVMQYLKGDIKLGGNGKPILVEPRKVLREFTLLMVDGLYYFATEESSVQYRNSIAQEIQGWINSDIKHIQDNLLENAELFVYPSNTFGDTTATVRENTTSSVTVDQGLSITYYMPRKSYANAALRPALIASTKQIANQMLGSNTIAISDLISALKLNGGDDVISVEVAGLGGDRNFPIISLKDPAVKMSLRKKLAVLANDDLMVEDDISINFLRHGSVN